MIGTVSMRVNLSRKRNWVVGGYESTGIGEACAGNERHAK